MARLSELGKRGDDCVVASPLPALPCVSPLPNLSSIAFFSTSRAHHRHGWRPQPPTPARGKMPPKDRDAELLGAKPRRSSISAIPRPTRTASTRRSSKSCLTTVSDMLLSPEEARCPPHPQRSARVKSDNLLSSYHLPRNLLPRSESFLTQFTEFSSIDDAFDTPIRGFPKSQTTPALLSPSQDITSYQLLRPLDPPLPRSSTCDDLISPKGRKRPHERTRQLPFSELVAPQLRKQQSGSESPYPDPDPALGVRSMNKESGSISALEEAEVDPRFVFVTEVPVYWLGRYTTLADKLRTNQLIPQPKATGDNSDKSRTLSPQHKNSMEFESAERVIKREAMKTLRSFCKTEAARMSLKKFEIYMSQNDSSFSRQSATTRHQHVGRPHARVVRQPSVQYPPVNPAKPKPRNLNGSLPQIPPNLLQKCPNPGRGDSAISKSFTIGNFKSTDSFSSRGSSCPSQEQPAASRHARKMSYYSNISETRLRAVQERDARPKLSKTLPGRSKDRKPACVGGVPQTGSKAASTPLSPNVASIKVNSGTPRPTTFRVNKDEVRTVDGGASQSSRDNVATKPPSDVSTGDTPAGHSRRFRKSASMKKLFGASIKEIRKMGHRVSNTNGHDGTDQF